MHSNVILNAQQKIDLLATLENLCRIFWGPDHRSCEQLIAGKVFQSMQNLGDLLKCEPPDALSQLKRIVASYQSPESIHADLEKGYVGLFVSSRDGIVAPLYQSCYQFENAPLMGKAAVLMKKRLESKGLSVTAHLSEPPDHVSVELEYLYFLLQKGWADDAGSYLEEAVIFASQNMQPWINIFRTRLSTNRRYAFYALAASVLCAVLQLVAGFGNPQQAQ